MKYVTRLASAAFVSSAIIAGAAVQPAQAQTVSFASLPQGSLIYFQATVLSKMLLRKTDLKVRVVPMNGTEAEIAALQAGRADLFLSDVTQSAAAIKGLEHFKGKEAPKLRAIARLMAFPVSALVKKDSKFQTIADLKGSRMPVGWTAFKQGEVLLKAVLAAGDLTLDDLNGVPSVGLIRAAEDFKTGKTVGTIIVPTAPKTREVNAALGGVRFISLGDPKVALPKVKTVREDFYVITLKPAKHLTGILKPTTMLAFDVALTTATHLSDEAAYKIAKAVYENQQMLAKGHPTFRLFRPKLAAKQFSVLKYHPGAIKFYKEVGIWPGK